MQQVPLAMQFSGPICPPVGAPPPPLTASQQLAGAKEAEPGTYISGHIIENNVVTKIATPYSSGPIACPYQCGRTFKHATQKAIHVRKAHTFERPFVCKVEGCNKAFFSSGDLKTHTQTHSGDRPFKCSYCDKALSSRNALKVHVKALHTLERPFKCEYPGCSITYMTRIDLDRHLKKHQKWEDKEEKLKTKQMERRVERSEKKVADLQSKLSRFESKGERRSAPTSVGRLIPIKPGDHLPEGAVAVFVPNMTNASIPVDKFQVIRRPVVKRAKKKDDELPGGMGEPQGAPPMPLAPAALPVGARPVWQEGTTLDQFAGVAAQMDAQVAAGAVQPVSAAHAAVAQAVVHQQQMHMVSPEGADDARGVKRQRAPTDPERAQKQKAKKEVDGKLRQIWEERGLAAQVPYQSWRRGLSSQEVNKLTAGM
mmetsp:Transcript_27324/g.93266  ORF Transcript_27324/g.93266 Transcript_27324/m.93266 type:complete len:426 (-) Transcript_27324:194-1471(-)